MAASDLGELTLSEGGTTLTLVRHGSASAPVAAVSPAAATPVTPAVAVPAARVPAPAQPAAATQASGDVNSPLYGILHLTPSPDEPAFVAIGATVTEGQTLCIVEAMKMFHEVTAGRSGRIAAIHVNSGDEVSSGQLLFDFQ